MMILRKHAMFQWTLLSSLLFGRIHSLSNIRVSPVQINTPVDVTALADLRYDEWMAPLASNAPSKPAFRAATAELHAERVIGGSVCYLARRDHYDKTVVVGAAELSPIELQGALLLSATTVSSASTTAKATAPVMLYVTDVVTDRKHRRQGVAASLMRELEVQAAKLGASQLLLHVEEDNTSALSFYQSIGYISPSPSVLECLNVDRLAENTGNTVGQVLLCKPVLMRGQKGAGFGAMATTAAKKQKKRSTR
jgi:ribosomal protein S18 acetylase RimI-like enzyme